MKVSKIVITGGPCAGKTTGFSFVEREMTKRGYKVVVIPETATELILSGLEAGAFRKFAEFERSVVQLQMAKEEMYERFCESLPDEKILLLCDRGVMDCKAYVGERAFSRMLLDLGLNEIDLRDKYHAVFHLVTAAKGAEDSYTTSNNSARRETLEEARAIDDKTIAAWTGSPHFRVIDNSTAFEDKLRRLVSEICACLGEPVPMEIERKYLIEKPNLEMLEKMPNCNRVDIVQTYLKNSDGTESRIRQRGRNGSYVYTLTSKRVISDTKREESERRISEKEYLSLLVRADSAKKQIIKKRYLLTHDNRYFEIDIYPFADSTAILEIELSNENEEVVLPPFIKVIKDVTGVKEYFNSSLALSIPKDLK